MLCRVRVTTGTLWPTAPLVRMEDSPSPVYGAALLMRLGGNTLRGSNPRSSAHDWPPAAPCSYSELFSGRGSQCSTADQGGGPPITQSIGPWELSRVRLAAFTNTSWAWRSSS